MVFSYPPTLPPTPNFLSQNDANQTYFQLLPYGYHYHHHYYYHFYNYYHYYLCVMCTREQVLQSNLSNNKDRSKKL